MDKIHNSLLVVKTNGRLYFLKKETVHWIQAEANYVRIFYEDKNCLVRETMKEISQRLEDGMFIRINRSILLNINSIDEMKFHKSSKVEVLLTNNKRWLWGGRSYHNNLNMMLKSLINKTV